MVYMLTTFFLVGEDLQFITQAGELNVNVLQRNHNRSRRFASEEL